MATTEKRPRHNLRFDDDDVEVGEQVDNPQEVIPTSGSVYHIGQSRQIVLK
jgi:hypothetical protein